MSYLAVVVLAKIILGAFRSVFWEAGLRAVGNLPPVTHYATNKLLSVVAEPGVDLCSCPCHWFDLSC